MKVDDFFKSLSQSEAIFTPLSWHQHSTQRHSDDSIIYYYLYKKWKPSNVLCQVAN